MRKMAGFAGIALWAVCIGLAGILLSGCAGDDGDGSGGGGGGGVTSPPPDVVSYDGPFVDGDSAADGGDEEYTVIGLMGVRLDANDISKYPCQPGFYFLDGGLIESQGALAWTTVDGALVFTAKNFTSPRSGLKYRFMGWTLQSSGDPLVTDNPVTIADPSGTLRAYWATVQ